MHHIIINTMCNVPRIANAKLALFKLVEKFTFENYKTIYRNSSYTVNKNTTITLFHSNPYFNFAKNEYVLGRKFTIKHMNNTIPHNKNNPPLFTINDDDKPYKKNSRPATYFVIIIRD